MHADAVTNRLDEYDIQEIYSSSCGRAFETACHIARVRKMEVQKCEFMREIKWGSINGNPTFKCGHPWNTVYDMVSKGESVINSNFESTARFSNNKLIYEIKDVASEFDKRLVTLGYIREGLYYKVSDINPNTVVMDRMKGQ